MNRALLSFTFLVVLGFCLLSGSGCASIRSMAWWQNNASVTTTAGNGKTSIKPRFTTAVYRAADAATADIFLTDLPMDRLADPADRLEGVSGSLIHIAVFLRPQAGKTPIDPTACTASIRQFIFSDGAVGLYAGGGFVSPGEFGKERVSGSISGATVRLVRATSDFTDLLGPSNLAGSFSARYNEEAVRALMDRVMTLSATLPVPEGGPGRTVK